MAKKPVQRNLTKKHMARLERERIQRRNLIIGTSAVVGVVVLLILYGVLDQNVFQKNKPVAQVGSQTITTGAFQTQVRYTRFRIIDTLRQFSQNTIYQNFFGSYIQQLQSQLTDTQTLGQQVLDQMVEGRVLEQVGPKMGIAVSEADIDKQVEENFGFFPNGTQTPTFTTTPYSTSTLSAQQMTLVPPTETPTVTLTVPVVTPTGPTPTGPTPTIATATPTPNGSFTSTPAVSSTPAKSPTPAQTDTPAPTDTPYTTQEYKANYDNYIANLKTEGFSEAELRQIVKYQIWHDKMFKEITKDIQPVQTQVWARHILVATQADAETARKRLMNGESFAAVAKAMSTDTNNKDIGGDLGWFTKDAMVVPFADAAFSLKIGEISQPVQSTFGWHIIQVLGNETRPLTDTQLTTSQQNKYSTWLDAQKKTLNAQEFDNWKAVVPVDPTLPPELVLPTTPPAQ